MFLLSNLPEGVERTILIQQLLAVATVEALGAIVQAYYILETECF